MLFSLQPSCTAIFSRGKSSLDVSNETTFNLRSDSTFAILVKKPCFPPVLCKWQTACYKLLTCLFLFAWIWSSVWHLSSLDASVCLASLFCIFYFSSIIMEWHFKIQLLLCWGHYLETGWKLKASLPCGCHYSLCVILLNVLGQSNTGFYYLLL